jgi:predicted transcriptional regulator
MTPKQLKDARLKLGLTQKEMADIWGYTASYFQQLELGVTKMPRFLGDAVKWQLYCARKLK